MTIEDQLKGIILSRYKSIRAFTTAAGIPYTTLDSAFKRGISNAGISTMIKVFTALDLDIESIKDGTIKERKPTTGNELITVEEKAHLQKYRLLDPYGKEAVDSILEIEHRRCTAPAPVEHPKRHRPTVPLRRPFTQVAAAEGAGAFLLDSNYDEITVELNDFTQKADIVLKVVGRSMEPEIHDGDHILVRKQPSVEEGEIGVFIIDGNGFLKQAGPDRLISLNPDIEDVIINNQQTAECYGKYICVLDPDWVVEG